MKNAALLCCAFLLLVCNACEKEKEIKTKPVLPVFEDNFDRTSFGDRWTPSYDMSDSVYLENNMVVISTPFGGTAPRLELKEGAYNKPEFKLSMQFKLNDAAIDGIPSVRLFTNSSFTNFSFELRKDSWNLTTAVTGGGGVTSRELKADQWYLLQVSVTGFEKEVNVIEMSTGSSVMNAKLQFSQTVSGAWTIAYGSFNNPDGNTRKMYVDNFKIY